MNDNIDVEGPRHAIALELINDLMLLLGNAHACGLDRYDVDGEAVFEFGFWSQECAKILGVSNPRFDLNIY